MAEKGQRQNPGVQNSFNKGMVKDYNETFVGEGLYTHARNAVNNSYEGNVGVIGNEPSNLFCVKLPYTLIGCIPMQDDQWAIFTTNDVDSEIGIFDESDCKYTTLVKSKCLGFKRTNLITGVFRQKYDCEKVLYWDDGLNPTRTLNIDEVPFIFTEEVVNGCVEKIYTNQLDCESLRLVPLIKQPCIELLKGTAAGTLPNGSYQACIAYTINQVKVTDYIGLTEVQSLFTHTNVSSSLLVKIKEIDLDRFDEFELVILANINNQTTAKRIGYYSATSGDIYIDRWDPEYITVPVSDVVFRSEPIDKSDAMYSVNNYLLRVGVYSKFKFNYQPLANNIIAKWVAVEYPGNYYAKGGNNAGYLRDEQYSFFIRWIYNTGERSESYHIPGRSPNSSDISSISGTDAFEIVDGVQVKKWQVRNTASVISSENYKLADGGVVIAKGKMGYWESTEKYPNDKPEVWGQLCGKNIRHHKFPDATVDPILSHFNSLGTKIVVLGVEFKNIAIPLDENGNPIQSIIGYEILRGSRQGATSIVAKGIINNMREYNVPENPDLKGLYQNYPYNDLNPDKYLTNVKQESGKGSKKEGTKSPQLTNYKKDIFSFHSPDVSFTNPFLNLNEITLYQELNGTSRGRFETPYLHPKFKQITNGLDTALDVFVGILTGLQVLAGIAGGLTVQLPAKKNIPTTTLGVPQVLAEGPVGSIATALLGTAAVVNILINAAYATLFGSKVYKEQLLSMVLALIPFRQFATQYNSHGFYDSTQQVDEGNRRRKILDAGYIGSSLQSFDAKYQIGNIKRSNFVILKTGAEFENPKLVDDSRILISDIGGEKYKNVTTSISSYYGAVKVAIPSQYGQLDFIKQVPISNCIEKVSTVNPDATFTSSVMFGGDTYINRFTEKNSMFFFSAWLRGEPDSEDLEFDYTLYPALPYPRFWIDSKKYIGLFADNPSQYRSLDAPKVTTRWLKLYLEGGNFYLFNSGVRDFFVESEINLGYRDWEDDVTKRHYDPENFTDLTTMFRSDLIESGNYYKYDYSLSVSKLLNNQISWGQLLPRDYTVEDYSQCYKYLPNKVIYSLPQQLESKKDNWRVFLSNNYKNFPNPVTVIKPVNKTGALFMMKQASPLQFLGVEELKLDGTNTKVTIGDGGLFTGPSQLQAIVNADQSFEYASNQSRFSTIGTTKGIFWVSQNQGKIFQYFGQLNEISNAGMRWWFAKYLPSELLKTYANYPLFDNPVKGIGVQVMYDNTTEVLYVSKKDYKPLRSDYTYDNAGNFYSNGSKIEFDNISYFESACWTASYDTKTQTWISFHDWIPTFMLPSKTHFMSVNKDSIWKHNTRCDSYCNFYGVNYPFEIEFISSTGQQVVSMRNIEYLLEVYNYYNDCKDRFHVLDENFDQAIIYNSEQLSGLLNLKIKPKNNPLALISQPNINKSSIDIYYSKEEQKYRFNQFWDVTKNRGEFSSAGVVPMFITKANGYEYPINSNYVNYGKNPLERKKFRHNINRVFLRKTVSGKNKILFKVSNQNILASYR
jgi:hypothetical protein